MVEGVRENTALDKQKRRGDKKKGRKTYDVVGGDNENKKTHHTGSEDTLPRRKGYKALQACQVFSVLVDIGS